MNRNEFILKVVSIVNPTDFKENNHLLDIIDDLNYDNFITCLKMGSPIKSSFKALDVLNQITKETTLTFEDIYQIIPRFKLLILLFDERYL